MGLIQYVVFEHPIQVATLVVLTGILVVLVKMNNTLFG